MVIVNIDTIDLDLVDMDPSQPAHYWLLHAKCTWSSFFLVFLVLNCSPPTYSFAEQILFVLRISIQPSYPLPKTNRRRRLL